MSPSPGGSVHDLGDLLSIAARRALPAASRKRLALAFDVRGERVDVAVDPTRVFCGLYRVLQGLIDVVSVGALIVDARISVTTLGRCRCVVHAGASGLLVAPAEISEVLRRLGLAEDPHPDGAAPRARRAGGVCPATGAEISFACRPGEGAVFHVALDAVAAARHPTRDANEARAWIVDANGFCGDTLAGRLQRRGWATTRFDSLTVARRRLQSMPSAQSRPALVIVAETEGVDPLQVAVLMRALPDTSQCVHLVTSGSPALQSSTELDLRVAPLSPRDLDDFALCAAGAPLPSGQTRPAPLRWTDRGRLLVVDDQPVNRILASQIGELLGFTVEAVEDGESVIDRCTRSPPDVVLMDVRMPGIDGIETTRRLRALQMRGLVAPFPIIAATAETDNLRAACAAAGMSDFLTKPLMLEQMRDALLRQCAGCIAEAA